MDDCIFCKIVDNEIPSYKIYEDELVMAFLDISQVTPGHTLVIPKKHTTNFLELSPEEAGQLFERVNIITKLLADKLGVSDFNIINNGGAIAGQTVFHVHVHILPRYSSDDKLILEFNSDESINIVEIYEKLK